MAPLGQGDEEVRSLLKQATAHKRNGDWARAIESLRQAHSVARANGDWLDTKSRLRLPKYLAEAGHRDFAWAEFSQIVAEISSCGKGEWQICISLADVYREMARFLRHEQRFKDSFFHEFLSHHWWVRSLNLSYRYELERASESQVAESNTSDEFLKLAYRRNGELAVEYAAESLTKLRGILSDEGIEEFLDAHLRYDELMTLKPALTALFHSEMDSFPDVDLSRLLADVSRILRGNPNPRQE